MYMCIYYMCEILIVYITVTCLYTVNCMYLSLKDERGELVDKARSLQANLDNVYK